MSARRFPIAPLLALAVSAFSQSATSAVSRVGDVEIAVQSLPSKDNSSGQPYGVRHGCVEYRVRLKNLGEKVQLAHLCYPDGSSRFLSQGVVATRSVRLVPGQEVLVSLYQPPFQTWEGPMEVRVEGERRPGLVDVPSLRGWREMSGRERVAVLLSRAVPQEFRDRAFLKPEPKPGAAPAGAPGESGKDDFALLRSEMDVAQWSPHWLGYSCYDAVLLTGEEADAMPAPVQAALRRYVECGGMLLVHGPRVPAALVAGGRADGQGGHAVGFGRVAVSRAEGAGAWRATYEALDRMRPGSYQPELKPANMRGFLVAETEVPVRGLFLLVLLFGVAIGPVNLWLLARRKRRIWLWWNVPAISLLACLAVLGYSIASEGWTGRSKAASLTVLDEGAHRATTIGYLSYYCPLTPRAALQFSAESDVALLRHEPLRGYFPGRDAGGLQFVDWSRQQQLTAGWISARVPTYFQMRKSADRRERLTVEKRPDGSLCVVNALGADIRRLYVADAAGRLFEGGRIAAGARGALEAAAMSCQNKIDLPALFRDGDWVEQFDSLQRAAPPGLLGPGCYLAYLEKSPFVDAPLPGVDPEHTVAMVYGIGKGPGDGR